MKFSVATALMTFGLLSSGASASPVLSEQPVQRSENGSVVVYEKHMTINGVEGVYQALLDESLPEAPTAGDPALALAKRCGSNQVHCDYQSNRAQTGICGLLMDAMGADHALSASQLTSLCFTATNIGGNNRCCVAWQRRASGLIRGHLLAAATDSFRCDRDGLVSAWVADVNLNGFCMNQCLSNQDKC